MLLMVISIAPLLVNAEKDGMEKVNKPASVGTGTAREVKNENKETYQQQYELAKAEYTQNRENYQNAKSEILAERERIKECQTSETDDCPQFREQIREKNREFLLGVADATIAHLNEIISKIQASEDLTEDEINKIVEELQNYISEIEDIKGKITSASTADELKEAFRELKNTRNKVNKQSKLYVGKLWTARLGFVIERAEGLEARLDRILNELESQGYDISSLSETINNFNIAVSKARENYDLATEKMNEARTTSDSEHAIELLRESHELLVSANENLKTAHDILKDINDILRELRTSSAGASTDDTSGSSPLFMKANNQEQA